MFKARIIPIRACMRDFACRPAARACLGAEGSGLSKACRIEARSKRQRARSIPGVLQTAQTDGANCSLTTGIH